MALVYSNRKDFKSPRFCCTHHLPERPSSEFDAFSSAKKESQQQESSCNLPAARSVLQRAQSTAVVKWVGITIIPASHRWVSAATERTTNGLSLSKISDLQTAREKKDKREGICTEMEKNY